MWKKVKEGRQDNSKGKASQQFSRWDWWVFQGHRLSLPCWNIPPEAECPGWAGHCSPQGPGDWTCPWASGLETAQGTTIPCLQRIHPAFPLCHGRHFPWDNERVTKDPEKRLWDKSCSSRWAGDDEQPWGWEQDGADDSKHPAADIPTRGPFKERGFCSIPGSYSPPSFPCC